ncbi:MULTISPECIES: hypothetical protein [unclassified Moorena]|uniref:hypothetical protein n=1 Tax=unclassified Moorena TaxID=2683338 RepID=UPI0013C996BB|nr:MULTISPECIES: hypothetical protein [unclassified Moorena]NEO21718.1 hypothetical protein [Moorena sp. SIO4A5]NEP21305.1 hypothetical protein [Moorena sp. SIO3I6]NEQ62458.1 hypothetical protein [Moorena sp. SIO4A1]
MTVLYRIIPINDGLRVSRVDSTQFGDNFGISKDIKDDLKGRGAIFFEESPSLRSGILVCS